MNGGAILNSYSPAQLQEAALDFEFGLPGVPSPDPVGCAEYLTTISNGWESYLRNLYLSATPAKPITFEFGSFGIEKGLSSEITSFDDDGYLTGERVRIHAPGPLHLDQVGFTNAYFGKVVTPNLFSRGMKLNDSNYRQVFADKKVSSRVGVSAEYTWQLGIHTLRQAVSVQTGLKVADKIRFETYERLNTVNLQGRDFKGASGFAVTADKKMGKRLSGDLGFDHVDENYYAYSGSRAACSYFFSMNGDAYSQGTRYFAHSSIKIAPSVTAVSFYTHAIGHETMNYNQQNYTAGLNFDLKALIDPEKRAF